MSNEVIHTLTVDWFTKNNIFQLERQEIFKKQWIYAADESEFKNIGDYINLEIAGFPFVIVKKSETDYFAFHNFCLHRAAPLLSEKKGNIKNSSLTCRYHGWTYNLSGELIATPMFDINTVKQNCSEKLHEVTIGKLKKLIFVNLNAENSISFENFIAPVKNEFETANYDMSQYNLFGQMEKIANCNWKTWLDGYQECYHCTTIHPIFNRDFYLKKYKVENKENYSVHSCERKHSSESGEQQGLWLWHFPNLGLPCYENAYYTIQINPLSVNQTKLTYKFRFKNNVTENERVEFIKFVEKITIEDISICELVQKNLEVGIYQKGILNPEKENGVAYFHSLVKTAVMNAKDFAYGDKTI
ncbi:aromatic ring-hydroxylating oxygenase subunit alpha [Pigmentibacter ruber]|uniref:aromatic ring-hydroxylating oxygenase subunit alpha n=1 Tax=Pigmentibacter ruber TaxID=2683196 RepID=UPI00131C72C7|nr:SRPBCC family protein [Pigmentibacter ruber]